MPVDRTAAEGIGDTLVQMYADAQGRITAHLAAQLAAGLDAPDWAIRKLAAIGDLRRWTQRLLDGLVKKTQAAAAAATLQGAVRGHTIAVAELERLAATKGHGRLRVLLPQAQTAKAAERELAGSATVNRIAASLAARITGTHTPVLRWTEDAYRHVVATAALPGVAMGLDTRRDAAQRAWNTLLDQGVTGFTDRAGRNWNLATYVEMAVRTGVAQAAVEAHLDRLAADGHDLVIVSNAPQECASCRRWEGAVLTRTGAGRRTIRAEHAIHDGVMVDVDIAGSVTEAVAAGLMHPNCRHSLSMYQPGITRPPAGTADPQGDADRQRLRALERHVRHWRLRETAALTPEARRAAAAKTRQWQAALRQHVATTTAKRQPHRERPNLGNQRTS